MGDEWVCGMVGCIEMEIDSRKDEEYCGLEYKELWRACHWEEGIDWTCWVWFYDWWEPKSLVDLGQHEPKYGLFNFCNQEASEDGAARHREDHEFE